MKRILVLCAALALTIAPLAAQTAAQPGIDSSYVIPVRAGTDRTTAYEHAAVVLVAQGFAITGAVPGLALSGAATDNGMIAVNISIAPDGTAYCSAQLVVGSGGAIVGGTGAIGGGGALAVQRGSRQGKDAWARLERLAAALRIEQ